jgi:biopolymer transport protein ExbD
MVRETVRRAIPYSAVSIAALLVIFALLLVIHRSPRHATGFRVHTAANTCGCYPDNYRVIVLYVSKGGKLSLNSEPILVGGLYNRLSEIYGTRAEKVLYLSADNDLSFQRVMDVIDTVEQQVQYQESETMERVPIPQKLRTAQTKKEYMYIRIRLVTPGAVKTPCPQGCFNWGKDGIPMMPNP